jgi:hypoxanthine phosphoribosyltransferase
VSNPSESSSSITTSASAGLSANSWTPDSQSGLPVGKEASGGARSEAEMGPVSSVRDSDREVGEVLLSEATIDGLVRKIGAQITTDYAGRQPLLLGVLKGAVVFLADLMRAIDLPTEIDFLAVSSYGASTTSSGVVRIIKDLDVPLEGRDVILVEDIIDSGLTLSFLLENLQHRNPASLCVAALLVREGVELPERVSSLLKYTGVTLAPGWVVGYGLDAGNRNRHLRGLHHYVNV